MPFFMTIILPALVFLAVGGLVGIGLAFLHERFKTERNAKADEILRHLPGANCGGCGSAGCEAFALNLVRGEAEISSCNPCPPESVESIEKLLGKKAAPARRKKKAYQIRPDACAACGRCEKACPFQAVILSSGVAEIVSAKCVGCAKCVAVCQNQCLMCNELN